MRRRALVVAGVGLAAAAIFVACRNGGGGAAGVASPAATATLAATPVSSVDAVPNGCAASQAVATGDSSRTLSVDGRDRTYLLHVPPGYDGTKPLPLVLNLHGFGSSGQRQALYSRFPALADAEQFFVVSPDGAGQPQQWNIRRDPQLPDDVAFIRALLDTLEGELCVDRERVFAAGISNGAAFAQQLACAMPERFAAIAAVAALVYPLACPTDQPIAVIAFHGTADTCVPFDGGPVTCGTARGVVPSVEDSALNWARHDQCNLTASRVRVSENVRSIAYSECAAETAVVVFVIEGGGHTWPGSIDVARLGPTTQEIDATEQIWQFFTAQANLRASQ